MSDAPDLSKAPEFTIAITRIARLLATETRTVAQICAEYQFSQDFFDAEIAPNPHFQRVLADYTKEYNALGSTQKRLAFSALVALEEALPVLASRMGDRASDLSDAVATGKLLRELAGIAPPVAAPTAGSGQPFSININFGDSNLKIDAKPTALPADPNPPLELEHVPAKNSAV